MAWLHKDETVIEGKILTGGQPYRRMQTYWHIIDISRHSDRQVNIHTDGRAYGMEYNDKEN